VASNVQSAFLASTFFGFDHNTDGYLSQRSLDGWHEILRQSIPKLLPAGTSPEATELIQQVLNVLSSPLSGVALGLAGPFIRPVVALVYSLHNVATALVAGNFEPWCRTSSTFPPSSSGRRSTAPT
jgi:hypothetical protein